VVSGGHPSHAPAVVRRRGVTRPPAARKQGGGGSGTSVECGGG
jgi:hypothetical protein